MEFKLYSRDLRLYSIVSHSIVVDFFKHFHLLSKSLLSNSPVALIEGLLIVRVDLTKIAIIISMKNTKVRDSEII